MLRKYALIMITFIVLTMTVSAQAAIPLEIGTVVQQTLDTPRSMNFSFEGKAGERVYFAVTTPNQGLILELRLFGPSGVFVGEDSDEFLTQVGPFSLPEDGTYTASLFNREGTGEAYILVDHLLSTPIEAGNPIEGRLAQPGQMQAFTFEAEEKAILSYFLSALSAGISFIAPDGTAVIENGFYDDPGDRLTTLAAAGTYTLLIQTLALEGSDYTLNLRMIDPIPLASDETLSGAARESAPPVFQFESRAGKTWQLNTLISEEGGGKDLYIFEVDHFQTWEKIMAVDYGSGPNGNPRLEPFVAPVDGIYYVVLNFDNFDNDDDEFTYEISLAPSSIRFLSPGTSISGSTGQESGVMVQLYQGKAGERLQISLRRDSDVGSLSMGVYSPEDEVAILGGRNVINAVFEVELPVDGVYRFEVRNADYAPTTLDFTILVESSR